MARVDDDPELWKRAQRMTLQEFLQSLNRKEYNTLTFFNGCSVEFWEAAQKAATPADWRRLCHEKTRKRA